MDSGTLDRPPESELSVPTRVTSSPAAPARLMPYMGLCGLFPVSFSERAQMTQPFTFARVAADVFDRMPSRKALSEWNVSPSSEFS
jgi:hypothetical protein